MYECACAFSGHMSPVWDPLHVPDLKVNYKHVCSLSCLRLRLLWACTGLIITAGPWLYLCRWGFNQRPCSFIFNAFSISVCWRQVMLVQYIVGAKRVLHAMAMFFCYMITLRCTSSPGLQTSAVQQGLITNLNVFQACFAFNNKTPDWRSIRHAAFNSDG